MKKFMQAGLFMGTFLIGSQLFAQATEKKGELPVCPAKTEKPAGHSSAKATKGKYPSKPMKMQQHEAVPQQERKTR